jgi:hypothetical protein
MATKRRWLVRMIGSPPKIGYLLYFGKQPNTWPQNRFWQYLDPRTVREMWGIHLPPGGGPVELAG